MTWKPQTKSNSGTYLHGCGFFFSKILAHQLLVYIINVMFAFAPLFSKCLLQQVQVLVAGVLLAPGKFTITSVLRVMGLSQEHHFQNYHRVLNRAVWFSCAVN